MSDGLLTLNTERDGVHARVAASGELDVSQTADLRSEVLSAAEGARRVDLDLRAVDFVDSMALSTLIELHHTLQNAGTLLCVQASEGPVRSAIELTGLRPQLLGAG